jgi:SnoaL-like domain
LSDLIAWEGTLGSASASALGPKALVLRWVNAFNARNLDGLISCLHPEVDFRPLKLVGIDRSYRGHQGVRVWFGRLEALHYRHRIELTQVREGSREQLLAIGTLSVAQHRAVVPFCASHWLKDELIVAVHHYPREPDSVERAGLLG